MQKSYAYLQFSRTTIYVLPRGETRRQLIGLLRQGRKLRRPRGQGKDRRGGLVGMTSIHERPSSVLTRELFGDWEGDLIKGAGNASAIGTLVERKSRFTILCKSRSNNPSVKRPICSSAPEQNCGS